MDIDDVLKVAENFRKSLDTGDKNLIKKYSKRELLMALNRIHTGDRNKLWYKEIEKCIKEIDKTKESWIDKVLIFILGIMVALVVSYLRGCLKLGN